MEIQALANDKRVLSQPCGQDQGPTNFLLCAIFTCPRTNNVESQDFSVPSLPPPTHAHLSPARPRSQTQPRNPTTLAITAFRLPGLLKSWAARLRRPHTGMAQAQEQARAQAIGNAAPAKQKLFGRAFYESIGSPKHVVAPMVDQSEFVSSPAACAVCSPVCRENRG